VLAIMLVLTIAIMALQSFAGWGVARLFGLPPAAGVMLGTAALVGGHGTAIAWGPTITAAGVPGGAELGIAMATMGLIAASLLGGPIARFLIERHRLSPGEAAEEAEAAAEAADPITAPALMRAILALNLAILAGTAVHELMQEAGIMLPLFVPCLLLGILISNLGPRLWPSLQWPGGGPALALVGEFSLSVFLAMSLMSMALWTLSASAGVLLAAILVQAAAVSAFIILVLFPVLGRNYFAAVMAAGSAGLMIGATPTAIANMNAVTRRYGPAPLAFIVLPLVSAFFIDVLNVAAIQTYLRVLG
jgi:ESS family glutamate:Na+ symporter